MLKVKKNQLTDVQKSPDHRGVTIHDVGVKNIHFPLRLREKNGGYQTVSAQVSMGVELPHHFKGTHMSRFLELLNDWHGQDFASVELRPLLEAVCRKLEAEGATITFRFRYFILKKAPVSAMESLMDYRCLFQAQLYHGEYQFVLGVEVPITTLCPCSKEISDYGAHNQRGWLRVKVTRHHEDDILWIEDLVADLEKLGSCPVFPLLKREDEKWVTEAAYDNPKFVEDVLRDAVLYFENNPKVAWFTIEVENAESIHNHEVYAHYRSDRKNSEILMSLQSPTLF